MPVAQRTVSEQRPAEAAARTGIAPELATVGTPGANLAPLAQPLQRYPAPPPAMPLAAPVQLQRVETASSENSISVDPGESGEEGPNIDELTEQVWRKLENRIRVERERQFGLP